MACGQKKQNTESGVHLTERTCSPYNPIIKQMVDDCLGLPIYPVTSIDAVIDEEGKTLRQLLQELSDLFGEGNVDIKDIKIKIEEIEQALTFIENNYAQKTDLNNYVTNDTFNNLKKLVWAISALTDTTIAENVTLYENDGKTPKIVAAVLDLQNKLEQILGDGTSVGLSDIIELLVAVSNFDTNFNPNNTNFDDLNKDGRRLTIIDRILNIESSIGLTPGDDESLMDKIDALQRMQNALKDLLLAIANYDERANADDREAFGVLADALNFSGENTSSIIEVIYRIATLGTRVQALEEQLGGGGSISDRIEELEKTSAHLDQFVLDQMPQNLPGPRKEIFQTLKIGEYPPDTIDIIDHATVNTRRVGDQRLEYYKELLETDATSQEFIYDIYPFCHTNQTKGSPLYFRDGNNYRAVVNQQGEQLRAGDNTVNMRDVAQIRNVIVGIMDESSNLYVREGSTLQLLLDKDGINTASDIYAKLYLQNPTNTSEYVLYGDVENSPDDSSVTVSDINAAVSHILDKKTAQLLNNSPETINLPSDHSQDFDFGYMFYYESNKSVPSAVYPCIEGKLYLDYFTNEIYQFSQDKMNLVNHPRFEGTGNVEIEEDYEGTGSKNRVITISIDKDYIKASSDDPFQKLTAEYDNTTKELNINLGLDEIIIHELGDNLEDGKYYFSDQPEQIYATFHDKEDFIANGKKYVIADVSDIIDYLLGVKINSGGKLNILNTITSYISSKYDTATSEQILILDSLQNLIGQKYNQPITYNSANTESGEYYLTYNANASEPTEQDQNPEVKEQTSFSKYYASKIRTAKGDSSCDEVFSIGDVAAMIDFLLSGGDIPTNEVITGAHLIYVNEGISSFITPQDTPSVKNKIFRYEHTDEEGEEVHSWYYFNENNDFVPLVPEYRLQLDVVNNVATLYLTKDNEVVSEIQFKDQGKPNGSGSGSETPQDESKNKTIDRLKFIEHGDQDLQDGQQIKLTHPISGDDTIVVEDIPDPNLLQGVPREGTQISPSRSSISTLNAISAEFLSIKDVVDLDELTKEEGYTRTIYFTCLDTKFNKIKHVQQTTTYYIHDEENPDVYEATSEIRVISNEDIQLDVTYYIKDVGIYLRFDQGNNNTLLPRIITAARRSTDIMVDDNSEYAVLPGEIPNIATNETTIKLNIDTLKDIPGYEAIEIRGKFVIHGQPSNSPIVLLETLEQGENPSYEQAYDCPAILRGKTYEFSLFNGVFKYSRVTNS